MLNKIFIMVRLTRDPELRRTQSGTPVTSFSLAVDRDYKTQSGEKETDFIDVVAWRATAEFVAKYFTKGRMAVVEGRLQIRAWQDKEGNNRRSAEVVADNVYFGEWPGGVHGTEPVDPANLVTVWPIREVLQKVQILLRDPVGDLVAVAAPAIGQQVVDPLDQHRGLAAARACQQQEGTLGGHGPLTLHGVQPGQIPGDHRFPGGHIPLFKISHAVLHSLCFLKLTSILRQKTATVNGGTADFSVSVL